MSGCGGETERDRRASREKRVRTEEEGRSARGRANLFDVNCSQSVSLFSSSSSSSIPWHPPLPYPGTSCLRSVTATRIARGQALGRSKRRRRVCFASVMCRVYNHTDASGSRLLDMGRSVLIFPFLYLARLIDLVAEDNAIEDTIYHLHRALNAGRIDLDRFLRVRPALLAPSFPRLPPYPRSRARSRAYRISLSPPPPHYCCCDLPSSNYLVTFTSVRPMT